MGKNYRKKPLNSTYTDARAIDSNYNAVMKDLQKKPKGKDRPKKQWKGYVS